MERRGVTVSAWTALSQSGAQVGRSSRVDAAATRAERERRIEGGAVESVDVRVLDTGSFVSREVACDCESRREFLPRGARYIDKRKESVETFLLIFCVLKRI